MAQNSKARRAAWLGLMLAVALALYGVEVALPSPFPFLRLGLANIVTVLLVLAFGLGEALVVTILRVTVASLITGTFLGPSFALALAGGVTAGTVMWLASRFARPPLGVVGVSLLGALGHNIAQLIVVGLMFVGIRGAVALAPPALVISGIAGLVTGLVALFVLDRIPLAPAVP